MVQFYHQPTVRLVVAEATVNLPVKIGPYKVEKLLTTGTDAKLYLGLHEDSKQLAVLKVISHDLLKNQERKALFLKEAHILEGLFHTNIVQYLGHGEYHEGMYIAVEFVQGISLKQFILQRSLSLKRSIDITLKVLYALLYLHSLGIVHRDLKPENILITENSEVKLVDFGIAGIAEEESVALQYGTPSYMPPQEKRGSKKFDIRSDIYAMGVIFYELIVGRISHGVIDLTAVPEHLRQIVERSTNPHAEKRYQDVMEMIADLSIYLKKGLISADESVEDTLKDLLESIDQGKKELITPTPESLMDLDVQLLMNPHAKNTQSTVHQYVLPDGSFLCICAFSNKTDIRALLELKGLLERSKLLLEILTHKNEFSLTRFLERLEVGQLIPLKLILLHVSTTDNVFHFFSYGDANIYHISIGGQQVRKLTTSGKLFGTQGDTPNPINDRLDSSDTLLFNIDGSSMHIDEKMLAQTQTTELEKTAMGNSPLAIQIERRD